MTASRCFAFLLLVLMLPFVRADQGDDKKKKTDPVPEGLKALQHSDARVRYRAAQTLADLGPVGRFAIPELREALKDKNGVVRVKVAEALWRIDKGQGPSLLPVLLQAIKDKDESVRAAAPAVIALLGAEAKPALPELIGALKDKELDVKRAAAIALGELGPLAKDSAGELLALSEDKEFILLEPFVAAALANLGQGAVPVLVKALPDKSADRRHLAAYALGELGPGAAAAAVPLSKALENDDPATRRLAARALGKIGPAAKKVLPTLDTATTDKVISVRMEAALATWFITKDAKHIGVLVKALGDESPNVRDTACQALAAMKAGAKDAVEPVGKLLTDKDLRVRAIMTLGEIGPPAMKTVADLKKLTDDRDGETQLHAAFALWQITGEAKESLAVIEKTLATEAHYSSSIVILGEMGSAVAPMLKTLVALWREEDVAADRRALGDAIKKIDPKLAMKLGIQ